MTEKVVGDPLERVVGDREGTEELAGPGEYSVSSLCHQRQGVSMASPHSFLQPFLCRKLWVGWVARQWLNWVEEAARKSEQFTTVIFPPFLFRTCCGHLCVYVLYTGLQSNPTAAMPFHQLVEFIDLPLGYLFLSNITWPNYLCSEPTTDS